MKPKELKIFCFYCQDHEATRTRIVPIISENFADNGEHSHWSIVDAVTGKIIIEDIVRYNVEKKCILCNEVFVPKKSYYDTCEECLNTLRKSKVKL